MRTDNMEKHPVNNNKLIDFDELYDSFKDRRTADIMFSILNDNISNIDFCLRLIGKSLDNFKPSTINDDIRNVLNEFENLKKESEKVYGLKDLSILISISNRYLQILVRCIYDILSYEFEIDESKKFQ